MGTKSGRAELKRNSLWQLHLIQKARATPPAQRSNAEKKILQRKRKKSSAGNRQRGFSRW